MYTNHCVTTLDNLRHYENMPMQYLAIFYGCKNDNFQMKNCNIFLIFARLWVHIRTASLRRF